MMVGRVARMVPGVVAVVTLLGTSSWALGPSAPPRILDAGVSIDTAANGSFRLFASLDVEIPSGRVPDNVQSVTVAVPGRGTFTVPFSVSDLLAQVGYFANLSSAGVAGFPQGTYTFTVTDTAGGVSTATDDLNASTGIPNATGLALSGTISFAGVLELDLAATPSPTLAWNAVPGATFYRARVRNSFNEVTLASFNTSGTSATFPPGTFLPGREYIVRLEAFDSPNPFGCSTPAGGSCYDHNVRSRAEITVFTQGPKVTISRTGPTTQNPSLSVSLRVFNLGVATIVDALAVIKLPDGSVFPLATVRGLTIPGDVTTDFFNGPVLTGVDTSTAPPGLYTVIFRLIHSATGEELALATSSFRR